MTDRLDGVLARIDADAALWSDLEAVCALGGRFAGTDSEARARGFLAGRLHDACGAAPAAHRIDYEGWRRGEGTLEIQGAPGPALPCVPLVRSPPMPPGGLEAGVVDLGRGDAADFAQRASEIPGRIVLVRHEYMFAAGTIHRRRKYRWAVEAGAAGFLISGHLPGDPPVTGSSGAGPDGDGIPAAGLGAGFDEPDSNLRYVLTPADTLDKIAPAELRDAARLAATLALCACEAPELALR